MWDFKHLVNVLNAGFVVFFVYWIWVTFGGGDNPDAMWERGGFLWGKFNRLMFGYFLICCAGNYWAYKDG